VALTYDDMQAVNTACTQTLLIWDFRRLGEIVIAGGYTFLFRRAGTKSGRTGRGSCRSTDSPELHASAIPTLGRALRKATSQPH
jgi:hypothetical protein